MWLRRRSSPRSMPISAAAWSTSRSMKKLPSGRPAPRYAPTGVVLVNTHRLDTSISGVAYTPIMFLTMLVVAGIIAALLR